jgi:hypothetical protein
VPVLLLLALLAFAVPREAQAQTGNSVRLEVRLTPDTARRGARAPVVRSDNLLGDGRWLSTLRSGLPVRLHYRIEVWRSRDGWLDQLTRQVYWDVVLRHEPLLDQYTMLTIFGTRVQERRYATLDALTAALAFAYQINVSPAQPGSYYYTATMEVSTLSDEDIDELERFLEGDLGSARGEGGLGDALGRGATRFLLRLAGLPSLRLGRERGGSACGNDGGGTAQRLQRLVAAEQLDVLRLLPREPAYRPGQVDEVRLARDRQRVHPALLREMVTLPGVAGTARRHHVGPLVVPAAGERDQVVAGQALAVAQVAVAPVAVLAPVTVAGEEECVGDLAAEAAGNVDELHEADDRRFGQDESFAPDDVAAVRFDDLRLALDHQAQRAADRDHGQRFE